MSVATTSGHSQLAMTVFSNFIPRCNKVEIATLPRVQTECRPWNRRPGFCVQSYPILFCLLVTPSAIDHQPSPNRSPHQPLPSAITIMCKRATCPNDGKPTWWGCGKHIDQVRRVFFFLFPYQKRITDADFHGSHTFLTRHTQITRPASSSPRAGNDPIFFLPTEPRHPTGPRRRQSRRPVHMSARTRLTWFTHDGGQAAAACAGQ
jgi:hypothetical protein